MQPHRILRFSLYLLASVATSATAQLKFEAAQPIVLQGGEGGGRLTLTNADAAPVPLNLDAGPFFDEASHTQLTKPKVTFTLVAGGGALPANLAPGQMLPVQVNVTNVSGTSAAGVTVFNGNNELGKLNMVALDAPLNLSVDGAGAPDKPLVYAYGGPVTIALKNGDPQAYRVHWIFQIDNRTQANGNLDIAPGGASRIVVTPSIGAYTATDGIHPSAKQGTLLFSIVGPANIPSGLLPGRALPVNLLMQRIPQSLTTCNSYYYAAVLLLLGAIFSILVSSVLPNKRRTVDLRSQLHQLADRTTSISTRVDSFLRVLLRLERQRIEAAIGDTPAWLSVSADPFSPISANIDTLDKRLTAAERLDDLRRKHEQVSESAPPSVTDDIDKKLLAATAQLHPLNLSSADLSAANAFLDKAQAALDTLDDTDTLAKLIATNLAALSIRISKFPASFCEDLHASLPGLWVILDPERGFADPRNIVRPMLFAIDHGVAAIHLALDFAMVRASIPAAPSGPGNDFGKTARDRLLQRHGALLELLGTLSWRALREATILVAQMREDIYEEDVLAEIAKPGQAEITLDTQKARPYLPVFFTITFKDSRFNGAAAIQRMVCQWSFPDGLCESNWNVCHYFTGRERTPAKPFPPSAGSSAAPAPSPTAETHTPPPDRPSKLEHLLARAWRFIRHPASFTRKATMETVTIYAAVRGQRSAVSQQVGESTLKNTIQVQCTKVVHHDRIFTEFVTLSIALAGLLSGALDQLGKLDFLPASIAIIALGFGADAVKNLLTQTPKTSPPTRNPS